MNHPLSRLKWPICTLITLSLAPVAIAQQYSELWGRAGEKWSPTSRLPDFSFAGYHFGEDPIPEIAAACSVSDFGALGDDDLDDTQAFRDAIEATERGAILIPAGRYIISDILWIKKSGIVLRGEGPDATTLTFPRSLEDVKPNTGATTGGRPTSNYSWSGGFIWATGNLTQGKRVPVTSESARGSRVITLESESSLEPGERILIQVTDDDAKSLVTHLYSDDPGDIRNITKPMRARMVSRIESVSGNRITLERPLRWDIRSSWSPVIHRFSPTVSEVGVEGLRFEFPNKPYAGHFTELGANAIAMSATADCWIRDVHISNCDSGLFVSGMFNTIRNVVIESEREPHRRTTGHHGIILGSDCVFEDFEFKTHFIHDITVTSSCAGNVTKNGRGVNISLDHHRKANHENLFCNLDLGRGTEMWRSGGGASLGKHCGARTTFWGIRAERNQGKPPRGFGPDSLNLIGLRSRLNSQTEDDALWIEAIPPDELVPADLHAAQLARRLASKEATTNIPGDEP